MNDSELLKATNNAYDMVFKSVVDLSCLKAALELNLFDILHDAPQNLETLARITESVPSRMERFLIALRQMGLVVQNNDVWALTSFTTQFFVEPEQHRNLTMVPFIQYISEMIDQYFMHLADVVRGKRDFVSTIPYPPQTAEDNLYFETMHRSNIHFPVKLLTEHGQFTHMRHLIDVGGGIGDIASAVCEEYPELQVTLINLPSALELISDNIAKRGLRGRITPLALDMYRDAYPHGDGLLFSRILYPMNEQFCTMMCQKAYEALESGGRILILDMIICDPDKPNYDYLSHFLGAVGMQFSVLDFKSHTIYPQVLRNVGFEEVRFDQAYDHVLYQAVKP